MPSADDDPPPSAQRASSPARTVHRARHAHRPCGWNVAKGPTLVGSNRNGAGAPASSSVANTAIVPQQRRDMRNSSPCERSHDITSQPPSLHNSTSSTRPDPQAIADKPNPSSARPTPLLLPSGIAATHRTFFDPWNTSATGHQRAENRLSGSTSWRQSRNLKLGQQYQGGLSGGGQRLADTVGAGSEDFGKDGRKENGGWERGASGLRTGGQRSLVEAWGAKKRKADSGYGPSQKKQEKTGVAVDMDVDVAKAENTGSSTGTCNDAMPAPDHNQNDELHPSPEPTPMFRNLTFYINGSTQPHISDHKLKHLLALHGGSLSIALGRRSVTHVILGTTNARGGCGGGLAASKIQKEISNVRGKSVKFVGVEWVLECIRLGRRVGEGRFEVVKLAGERQGGIAGMLGAGAKSAGDG